jgi:hypothetical protein
MALDALKWNVASGISIEIDQFFSKFGNALYKAHHVRVYET